MTFGELKEYSEAAGCEIADRCKPGCRFVMIMADRSCMTPLMIASCLAAGKTYIPTDGSMPADRLKSIIEQVGPGLILLSGKSKISCDVTSFGIPVLNIENCTLENTDPGRLEELRDTVLDIDPAYVIFTSGSTGQPKGIAVSHRSVIDFTEWMSSRYDFGPGNTLANQAPFYFDLSVKDMYQTMRNGCSLYIVAKKYFMFPKMLVEKLSEHKVTDLVWSTSAFRMVADSGILENIKPEYLKRAILGGEALIGKHVNIWKRAIPGISITNLYGPTEVTVDCTYYDVDREFSDDEPVPIGKACENMDVMLLDDSMNPVTPGETGEICVRGTGLALGYIGDFEKTSESFVQNPLNTLYPERLYRTGDLARMNGQGELVYVSRKDYQVKHAGYRIETGEIENAVSACPGVREAAVIFDENEDVLVCYYSGDAEIQSVGSFVRDRVPSYMMPKIWNVIEKLPETSNGKIDRKALKELYLADKTIKLL